MKKVTLILVIINVFVICVFSQNNDTIKGKQESNVSENLKPEETGEYVLVLYNRNTSEKVILKKGQKIKVTYENYVYNFKKIDSITLEFVIVDGFPFKLSKIQKINYKSKKTSVPGAINAGVGGVLTIIGIAGLAAGSSNDDDAFSSTKKGIGAIVMVAGLAVSATGLVLSSVSIKYDLINDWKAKTEILVE